MSSERKRRWRPWVLVALAIYPLSMGPAYWLLGDYENPYRHWFFVIYKPLGPVVHYSPAMERVTLTYLELWSPHVDDQ